MVGEDAPIRDGVCLTPLERRLARRIHNQRRRLAQMEMFKGWHHPVRPELVKAYRQAFEKKSAELKRLKSRGFWSRLFNLT